MPFAGHSSTLFIFLQHKSPRFHGGFYSFHTSQHHWQKGSLSLYDFPGFCSLMGYGGIYRGISFKETIMTTQSYYHTSFGPSIIFLIYIPALTLSIVRMSCPLTRYCAGFRLYRRLSQLIYPQQYNGNYTPDSPVQQDHPET